MNPAAGRHSFAGKPDVGQERPHSRAVSVVKHFDRKSNRLTRQNLGVLWRGEIETETLRSMEGLATVALKKAARDSRRSVKTVFGGREIRFRYSFIGCIATPQKKKKNWSPLCGLYIRHFLPITNVAV